MQAHVSTPALQLTVARHSLAWLLVGSLVGLGMSLLLLRPEWGVLLGPLTYGRWATVHLNVQLYGWCSVPLLGLLFRWYLPAHDERGGPLAVQTWSGALLFSVVAWLAGEVSGKPFMEWRGLTRWIMPAAMVVLAGELIAGYARRMRTDAVLLRGLKFISLLTLAAVPFVMAWAADPGLYPVINPDSGGATGGSLLGSTLGIVILFLIFPWMVNLPVRRRSAWLAGAWVLLAAHYGWFFALDHGHRSHHEQNQIVALFSLVLWWPVLVVYLRHFTWPAGSQRWLFAFAGWGALLLITALYTFLPGILDRWKFTNALVAHTHIAMAGMLTCYLVLLLVVLDQSGRHRDVLTNAVSFGLWHGGTYGMCGVLLWLGLLEADQPGLVFSSAPAAQIAYLARTLFGAGMTWAAYRWWSGLRTPGDQT